MKKIYYSFLFVFLITSITTVHAQQLVGIISDDSTSLPIPYANIGLTQQSIGTTTNSDGFFNLPYSSEKVDTIVISHIGFETFKMPLAKGFSDTIRIKLKPATIELGELVITPMSPEEIILRMLDSIPNHYPSKGEYTQNFFREWFSTNENGHLREAAFKSYTPAYTTEVEKTKPRPQLKLLKGRIYDYIIDEDIKQLVSVGVGPYGVFGNNVLLFRPPFLTPKRMKWFDYQIKGLIKQDGKTYYTISFMPKQKTKKRVFAGELIIDADSYELLQVNKFIPDHTKEYFKPGLAGRSLMAILGIEIEITDVKTSFSYVRDNKGKLRPSYSRADGYVTATREKKNEIFKLVIHTQLSFNKVLEENAIPFTEDEFKDVPEMENSTGEYSESYWKGYPTVAPTKELKEVIEKIRQHAYSIKKMEEESPIAPQIGK